MLVVTGGAGFIGSALLWELNRLGCDEICVVDHLGNGAKWQNLVKRRYADYLSRERFLEMIQRRALPWKVDALVHLGACSATTECDCDFLMENNFSYSRELCRYALERGIRMLNASSAATYGDGSLGFSDDPGLIPKLRPLNMYGYSKQLFDLWLLREGLANQLASLKFFNVYGPNEYHKGAMKSVAAKAHAQIHAERRLTLFASSDSALADGEQQRDFVYVKDCVAFMAWLLQNPRVNGIRNVGVGKPASFNELGRAAFAALGLEPRIEYIPMPGELLGKYQNYTCADMAWLEEAACPVRFRPVAEGVADYYSAYLETQDAYL